MAHMLHISHGTMFTIQHDHLNMRQVCVRLVPRLLMPEQKLIRVEVYQNLQCVVMEHVKTYLNSILLVMRVGFITMILKANR